MSELRLVSFNMWVGNAHPRDNLIDLAEDTGKPHILALQEARRFNGTIPGYERHATTEEGNPESDNCVLLIRKRGVDTYLTRDLSIEGPDWVGPKHGLVHPPRDFPGLSVETDGQRWDVVDIHRTWTGGLRKNMGSYTAEHEQLVAWIIKRRREQPDRPLVLVGDWNSRKLDPRPLAVSGLARCLGTDRLVLVKGIDGAIANNAKGSARKLKHKYGSDGHRPVEITLRSK